MTRINDDFTQVRWFRSKPAAPDFDPNKIDTEAGIIRDVVYIEEGEAKGHDVSIDGEFIERLVEYDQNTYGDRGVKVRLGHPSASDDTMGKQLGFMRNFRRRRQEGKMQAIADLHLLSSADASPTAPGMREWVIQMAQEAPDFIMSSIVFKGSGFYQRKANGHKKPVASRYEAEEQLGPVFIEFDPETGAEHYYTDLVEQGAATENLFSTRANPHLFVSRLHEWLDLNPDIREFVQNNPDAVQALMQRLGITAPEQKKNAMSQFSLKSWLFGTEEIPQDQPLQSELSMLKEELAEAKEAVNQLRQERDEFKTKFEAAEAEATRLREETISLKSQAEDLQQRLLALEARVVKVENAPAAEPTGGDTDPAGDPKPARSFENREIYQRARQYWRRNS